jgi:hypothetical protein
MKVFCAAGLTTGWVMTSFRPPELSAVFVVKGTYRLSQDGEPTLYDEPDPARGDLYLDDDFEKPLLYDSDFALFKPRTDLLLVGSCHAPGGRSIPMTRVTFSVGSFVKSLAVIGDREWKEGVFSDGWTGPKPFTSMPVRYDYAFGGEGNQQNPLGNRLQDSVPSTAAGRLARDSRRRSTTRNGSTNAGPGCPRISTGAISTRHPWISRALGISAATSRSSSRTFILGTRSTDLAYQD